MPVCAWVDCDVAVEGAGAFVCACREFVEVLGLIVVEADGVWVVVVSGAFCVVVEADVLGVVVVEFGDCANAAVANTRPTAVLIRKRVFMLQFLRLRSARTSMQARGSMGTGQTWQSPYHVGRNDGSLMEKDFVGNIRRSDGFARILKWRSKIMKTLLFLLAVGAGALLSSGVNAAPISIRPSIQPDSGIEQVRLVCDDYGRCYRTRGGRRVVIQQDYGDSYNYVPRERYIERRGYYDGGYYNSGPSLGIGVGPDGVGVGFGVGPRW